MKGWLEGEGCSALLPCRHQGHGFGRVNEIPLRCQDITLGTLTLHERDDAGHLGRLDGQMVCQSLEVFFQLRLHGLNALAAGKNILYDLAGFVVKFHSCAFDVVVV